MKITFENAKKVIFNIHITDSVDIEAVLERLSDIEANLGDLIMATKEEVLAAAAEETTEVLTSITALEVRIQELIDAQEGASPADLDEILEAVRRIHTPAVVEVPVVE